MVHSWHSNKNNNGISIHCVSCKLRFGTLLVDKTEITALLKSINNQMSNLAFVVSFEWKHNFCVFIVVVVEQPNDYVLFFSRLDRKSRHNGKVFFILSTTKFLLCFVVLLLTERQNFIFQRNFHLLLTNYWNFSIFFTVDELRRTSKEMKTFEVSSIFFTESPQANSTRYNNLCSCI